MANLLSIGHTTLDTFLMVENAELTCDVDTAECQISFDFGAKIPVSSIHYGIGGGAANVAVGLQKLGHTVSLYTTLGNDSKGKEAFEQFENLGVDCTYIKKDADPTDQSTIVSYEDDRVVFSYCHQRQYRIEEINHRFPYVLLSSVGSDVSGLYQDIARIKEQNPNKVLFFNPGSRELQSYRKEILQFLPEVDYLIVNFEEACTILNPGLQRNQIETFDLMNMLLEKGANTAVVTDAENGVYISHSKDEMQLPAYATKIVEKTGAGDAFTSGFIAGIMYEKDIRTSAKWGLANAASVMQVIGAQNGLLDKKSLKI